MFRYTNCPSDLKAIKRDKHQWIIHLLREAIERLPKSPDNPYRQELIDSLEKRL